jgi:glycosyltransferase involved in cell wall biosynthesis
MNDNIKLSLVVPVYNEEHVVEKFIRRIDNVFHENNDIVLEVLFVNDGSTDHTLNKLLMLQRNDHRIKIVDLSRNFGKEAALTAGLETACGDVIVPIDADLQDPPELIPQMLAQWRNGYEVVLARRINRNTDSWPKRLSAGCFYKIHNRLSCPQLPENVGDFRLLDRKVVNALCRLPESNRFMKGLFAWAGFRSVCVDYVRQARQAGTSKFNGWKLWNFALEGITSFSSIPLRIWTYVGIFLSVLSIIYACYIIVRVSIFGIDVPGYASIIVITSLLGGIQLMGIGIIGEYLGRTYIESKNRPIYFIRNIYNADDEYNVK